MLPRDFLVLSRLARARRRSEADYRRFQAFQARLVADHLVARGFVFAGRRVLDLGSGIGGYSEELARRGGKVVAVDLAPPLSWRAPGVFVVAGSALAIPLADGSADAVFCASLIEHVEDPARLLAEIARVVRPNGLCYVSFPPYWSPVGGHEFSPFHYLGERLALRLARRRAEPPAWVHRVQEAPAEPRSFARLYKGWGLYRMTVARMRRLLARSPFETLEVSTRYLPFSFVRWPLAGELLTWHAQFLLRRRV
jgi:SAM-dependent methyltransferase